jgi:hypothetical protein
MTSWRPVTELKFKVLAHLGAVPELSKTVLSDPILRKVLVLEAVL